MGHILSSGRHLLRLINDMLDLSKVEAGKLVFFPEALNLPALVGEVSEIMHTEVQHKRQTLLIDIDPMLSDLHLDPMRLRQVLYNFLSNAIKFTPVGGGITVRARAQGARHFRLEVEDTGIGMAAADLPGLFSDYRQLDAGHTRRHQGTGLGLALTRRLVEAQAGNVGARSTPGSGSVFHLLLNRQHGTDALCREAAQARRVAPADQQVLVVHDGATAPGALPNWGEQQPALARALLAQGYRVDVSTTCDAAVHRARAQAYDAITLHLEPPAPCGLGVLQRIRSSGMSRSTPVMAMSMAAQPGAAVAFAVADVLCKPLSRAAVAAALAPFRNPGTLPTNVLVIDDDPAVLAWLHSTLAALDIAAVCLQDGQTALRDIDQHRPDAILLDLMMPGHDGFAVLDALRQLPAWCHTPVFICTSLELSDAEYACLTRSARVIHAQGGGRLDGRFGAAVQAV
jgi:CheY-like chemotaxis protein